MSDQLPIKNVFLLFLFLIPEPSPAENFILSGNQESKIRYRMTQKVQPMDGMKRLTLSYVVPTSYDSPTYHQQIRNLNFSFNPRPTRKKERIDERGNKVMEAIWEGSRPVTATIDLTARNRVNLKPLKTDAPFPLRKLPAGVKTYLEATSQVESGNREISAKARALTKGSKTEFDAVQKILTWVVDHMNYILTPKSYKSTYSFRSGKGNCQNYSHLSAALMRAVGIPVRIVNGVTLDRPYDIAVDKSRLTMKMAKGRHSWIEVYFPDLGWVPFDPAGTELFVSNRFLRIEVGKDNNETKKDGLVRWAFAKGARGEPRFEELIEAKFESDSVNVRGKKTAYGPKNLLLMPEVKASFVKVAAPPPPPPPRKVPQKVLKKLVYKDKYVFGNLDFPENADFLFTRGPAKERADGTMEMRKNFLVETAEYVTTQGQQYAQTFILDRPIEL